jgi:hypothetical protein
MMNLSTEFNVFSKNIDELKGYYRVLFNLLVSKPLTKGERELTLSLMTKIKNEIHQKN